MDKRLTEDKYSIISKIDKSIDINECNFSEEIKSQIEY